jgi:putative transposase
MDQRRRFIEDWLSEDWTLTELCAAFGISRPTAYKWLERFKLGGIAALADRPRAHHAHPSATDQSIESEIVQLRHRHPFWGPRKLKARLERLQPDVDWPASSTIVAILNRHGLVTPRRRRC